MERISPYLFARDHWSLLVYIETRCVDYKGTLDYDQLRINYSRHSMQKSSQRPLKDLWYSEYSTKIKGKKVIDGHDDIDCLDDFEACGYIEIQTGLYNNVTLTELGITIAHNIRRHMINGKMLSNFELPLPLCPICGNIPIKKEIIGCFKYACPENHIVGAPQLSDEDAKVSYINYAFKG